MQPGTEGKTQEGKPLDLTQLSLEQLMDIELIPINVLGGHTHVKGETMFGYRYMAMHMDHNLDGGHRVSPQDVLKQYPVAHTGMTMEMHMLEGMYAPSDSLTLMGMLPYKSATMGHLNRAGVHYTTKTAGWSDLTLMALKTFRGDVRKQESRLIFNFGLSVPTGSVNKRYDTPTKKSAKLEYEMQTGSGTYDLLPGLTYLGESRNWAWGAQLMTTYRLGQNSAHYRLGDEQHAGAWGYYKVNDAFGPSLRLEWSHWGDVHGADPELNRATNPAFDPDKQRGRRLDLFLGLNFYVPKGRLKGHRLTLEGGWPIDQNIAGPNLETSWQWTFGWSYTFGG